MKLDHPARTLEQIVEVRQDLTRSPTKSYKEKRNNLSGNIHLCSANLLRIVIYTHIISRLSMFFQSRHELSRGNVLLVSTENSDDPLIYPILGHLQKTLSHI